MSTTDRASPSSATQSSSTSLSSSSEIQQFHELVLYVSVCLLVLLAEVRVGQTLHLEEQELQASLAYLTLRKPGLWCGAGRGGSSRLASCFTR